MGFQDTLHALKIPYCSDEAVEFADKSMEMISYFAYSASSELAEERLIRDFQGFIMGQRYSR